jgi:hypothetical protein
MKSIRIQEIQRRVNYLDIDTRYDQISQHLRRKTNALQSKRWRKLNRHMDRSPYLDSQLKHGGGVL